MPESLKKIPPWAAQILIWIVVLIFSAGAAYETFAPKTWVQDRITEHEVRTEEARKEDMKDIKEALKRIEERQYEAAKSPK